MKTTQRPITAVVVRQEKKSLSEPVSSMETVHQIELLILIPFQALARVLTLKRETLAFQQSGIS